jgi:hypothetical protein
MNILTLLAAAMLFADPPAKPETIKVPTVALAKIELAGKDYLLAKKDQEIARLQFERANRAEADASIASKAALDAIFAEAKVPRAEYEFRPQTGELVRKDTKKEK